MLYTGEVYQLPPDDLPDDDAKYRPHVLLTEAPEEDAPCTFAYCSRQATEMSFGAPACLIDPHRTTYRGTGLTYPTYVYPNRLVTVDSSILDEPLGRIIDEVVQIRDTLRRSIGLGTGNGSMSGSWRGQVVVLKASYAAQLGTPYCLVVTEHTYSLEERFQLVIPILDADGHEAEQHDLVVTGDAELLGRLGIRFTNLLFAVSIIESLFHGRAVERGAAVYLPDDVMAQLDLRLMMLFNI